MQRRDLVELVKWGGKSALGLGLNLALLTGWVELADIRPEVAVLVNWLLVTTAMYVVTDRWVYSARPSPASLRGHARRYVELELVKGASKLGNYAIFLALLEVGVVYQASWAIGAVAMFGLTFVSSRYLWGGSPATLIGRA